ncbi:MAG: hypothetical protein M1830_005423 [Pleopsidium flavum]|nr:MAG: hypothetical protein M1830_005423 [Pleopsidium flavum]
MSSPRPTSPQPRKDAPLLHLSLSTPADNLTIVTLHVLVFSHDLIDRVLFPTRKTLYPQIQWSLKLLRRAEAEPDAQCIRAVDALTGEDRRRGNGTDEAGHGCTGRWWPIRDAGEAGVFKGIFCAD